MCLICQVPEILLWLRHSSLIKVLTLSQGNTERRTNSDSERLVPDKVMLKVHYCLKEKRVVVVVVDFRK